MIDPSTSSQLSSSIFADAQLVSQATDDALTNAGASSSFGNSANVMHADTTNLFDTSMLASGAVSKNNNCVSKTPLQLAGVSVILVGLALMHYARVSHVSPIDLLLKWSGGRVGKGAHNVVATVMVFGGALFCYYASTQRAEVAIAHAHLESLKPYAKSYNDLKGLYNFYIDGGECMYDEQKNRNFYTLQSQPDSKTASSLQAPSTADALNSIPSARQHGVNPAAASGSTNAPSFFSTFSSVMYSLIYPSDERLQYEACKSWSNARFDKQDRWTAGRLFANRVCSLSKTQCLNDGC